MRSSSLIRESPLGQACESYHNPYLKEKTYLSPEHRQQLVEDSAIVHWEEYKDPERIEGVGTFRHIGIVTAQGYEYGVLASEPETPYSDDNIPIIGTTAWFTSLEGFNAETVANLTKDGNYVWLVGAEGSYNSHRSPEKMSPISLANSSAAVLSFAKEYRTVLASDGDRVHRINPHKCITTGASRGANSALGITSLAIDFDQEIIYGDSIAPRYPKKLTLQTTPNLMAQVFYETPRLAALPFKLGIQRTVGYADTLDPSLHSLRHQVAIGGAIMNGETGACADAIGNDQLLDITLLSRDGKHEHPIWEEKFQDHPNVKISTVNGIHMSIPVKDIQLGLRNRIKAVRSCDALAMELTQENKEMVYEELTRSKRSIGRRALRIAV